MKYFHTAISVSNLEKSQVFYEKVFDLKFDSKGERPDSKIRMVNLKGVDGSLIELFQHESPIPLKEDLMDFQKVGIKHVAFIVENLEESIEKAVSCGAKILWPIQDGITIKRLAFVSDPDGIPIELLELRD